MTTTTDTAAPSALEDLAGQADALQQPPDGAAVDAGPAAPPPPDNAQIIGGAIAAGREAFTAFTGMRSVKIVLTDDKVQTVAAAWAPVLDKHGIDLSRYLGDYGAEIAAVVVTVGVVAELRMAVRAEIAQIEARKDADAAAAATAG